MSRRSLAHGIGIGLGLVAAPVDVLATAGFVHGGNTAMLAGLALHTGVVAAIAIASRLLRSARTEQRLLATMVAALPGVGALLASCHLLLRPAAAHNAHAVHDTDGYVPGAPRPTLEQELRVTSYTQLLREGSLEQKRNLLRRLASLGEPRYLTIVRRFLADAEPELRLCAYAELAAVAQRQEVRIGELRRTIAAAGDTIRVDDLAALASLQLTHATSGALDDEMARYWLAQAEQTSRRAVEAAPQSLPAQRVLALVLAATGRGEVAWQLAQRWPDDAGIAELEVARAEIAFRRRDRATCEQARARLEAAGAEVPAWLAAAVPAEVQA